MGRIGFVLVFLRNSETVFQSACLLHSRQQQKSFFCSASSPAFGGVGVLDFSHSNSCVVVSHCYFNLYVRNDIGC